MSKKTKRGSTAREVNSTSFTVRWGRWILLLLVLGSAVTSFSLLQSNLPKVEGLNSKSVAKESIAEGFLPTKANSIPKLPAAPEGMVWVPGGEFSMGCDIAGESLCSMPGLTRDASPIHRVYVDGFWMDSTEVTNEQFAKFVDATKYVTVAETKPTIEEFPGAPEEILWLGQRCSLRHLHLLNWTTTFNGGPTYQALIGVTLVALKAI